MIMNQANKIHHRRHSHCPVPVSTFTTYMDEGTMHYRAGKYRKALFCYDRAIELHPTHKGALVARSQCHLKLGDAEAALKDAEASFDAKFAYAKGLLQFGESLYNLGQFEKALIAYHKGNRMRRDMDGFRIGIQKCQEAITYAIGDPCATQIEDLEEIIPMIKEIEAMKNRKEAHCCIRPGTNEENRKLRTKLPKVSTTRARWVAREVLGEMYVDKEYFKKFLQRPDIQSDQGLAPELRASATEALNYLQIREEFWRLQNPMYTRKPGLNFNNNIVVEYEKEELAKQKTARTIKMDAAQGAVLASLAKLEHALEIGRAKDCQLECDRTLRQMKEMSTMLLPRKAELTCRILNAKGLAFEMLQVYDKAVETFQAELKTATDNHLTEAKSRAMDNLARSFAFKRSFTEAAEIWENRLSFAKSPTERAYLLHEIGRCYLEIGKLDVGLYYANQSHDEAIKAKDYVWAMNAKILLLQIHLKTSDLDAAYTSFIVAREYAIKSDNPANAKILQDGEQCLKVWIEKRQKEEEEESNSDLSPQSMSRRTSRGRLSLSGRTSLND